MALDWQLLRVSFGVGLDTEWDPRAQPTQSLVVCDNAEFEELGGLRKRFPYAALGTSILGGGTISNLRRLAVNGDERLLFTKDTLYSYSVRDTKWISKGTYLAPKLTERSVFARSAEQHTVARAELSGVVVYAWMEVLSSNAFAYVAAIDKVTGAVLLAPTSLGASTKRPRLIALTNKIILTYVTSAGTGLLAKALDPADLATSVAAAGTDVINADGSFSEIYDIVKTGATQVCLVYWRTGGTTYGLSKFGEDLSETQTTKTQTTTVTTPLAIAVDPTATTIFVFRLDGTTVRADGITLSSFADATMNTSVITSVSGTVNQMTAEFRSVQDGGQYRCYVFVSSAETALSTSFDLKYNWINTAYATGTAAVFVKRLGVASQAFDYSGSVFLWTVFAGESSTGGMAEPLGFRAQLQNTYFLYRDDGTLIAKAAAGRAGGFSTNLGYVSDVQSLGSGLYAWAGVERRIIPIGGGQSAYSHRTPRDIAVQFDSDEARRCVRLGKTLYVTGGQLLQYDGEGLVEVGFHIYPWYFATVDGGAGGKDAGNFTYKLGWRWDNNQGERDRSTTATHGQSGTLAASHKVSFGSTVPLHTTLKQGSRVAPAVEHWATLKDPVAEAPFYLVSSQDPSVTSNPNRYLENSPTSAFLSTFDDSLADATVAKKETHPENGAVLEALAPPAATIVAASQDRLFLAGISDNPYQVWYSRLRGEGEVASFHDNLTVEVPPTGGDITALAFLNETLVVFCERAIYALPGDGFDNTGGGFNYGPARLVSADVGAKSHDLVALTPLGLWFMSNKGWHLLDRQFQVQYVGGPMKTYDSDNWLCVHVMESKQQIRCMSSSRVLVFNMRRGQWSRWTVGDGAHAAIWDGVYNYCSSSAVKYENTIYASVNYSLDVETAWIYPAGPLGYAAVKEAMILAEYRSSHTLRIRMAWMGTDGGTTYFHDKWWTPSATTVGGHMQHKFRPRKSKGQAWKLRITDESGGASHNAPTGESLKLTGLALWWADMRRPNARAQSTVNV